MKRTRSIKKPTFIKSLIHYNKWVKQNPKIPRKLKTNNEEGD